jgi:hypothetical protein
MSGMVCAAAAPDIATAQAAHKAPRATVIMPPTPLHAAKLHAAAMIG